jgi:hypothetical protein
MAGGGGASVTGGGKGGPGLGLNLDIPVDPMSVASIGGAVIAILGCLELLRQAYFFATTHVTWTGLILPVVLAVALFLSPKLVPKILGTAIGLVIGAFFLWLTYVVASHAFVHIDEPFAMKTPDAAGMLRLVVGWVWLFALLAIPVYIAYRVLRAARAQWQDEKADDGGHH